MNGNKRTIEDVKREYAGVVALFREGRISKQSFDLILKGYDEELRAMGAPRTG